GKSQVDSKIQAENVHAWIAKKAEIRAVGKLGDDLIRLLNGDAASLSHTVSLSPRRIGTDVGIETRAGSRNGISRDRRLRREYQRCFVVIEGLDQLNVIEATVGIFKPVQRRRCFKG